MVVTYEYDVCNRLKYHPELHERHYKYWLEDELEYICKFHDVDELTTLALAVGRPDTAVASQLSELRKNGKYEYYRNLDKHYVSIRR